MLTHAKFIRRCLSITSNEGRYRSLLRREPCVYCGDASSGLDHITASTIGGPNGWTNRAPACHFCDALKGNEPLVLFLVFLHHARRKHMTGKKLHNAVLNHFRSARDREQQLMTRRYLSFQR